MNGNEKRAVPALELSGGVKTENPAVLVYNKVSENLIENSFVFAGMQAGHEKLCSIDSITWKQMFVEWANEFETVHTGIDWDQNDYLEEIEMYARHKILEFAGLEG